MGSKEDFKRPNNTVTNSLSLLSVILAAISIFWNVKETELSYLIESTTKVIDSALTTQNIKALYDNGEEITSNIYSTSVVFWNSGDKPINNEDIRVPPSISITGIDKIIGSPVFKESNPETSDFRLLKDSAKTNYFSLKWKYFDPGNVVRVKFFYTAIDEPSFDVNYTGTY